VRVHAGDARVVGSGTSGGGGAAGDAWAGAFGGTWPTGHLQKAAVTNALKAALHRLAIVRFSASGMVVVRAIDPADDGSEAGGSDVAAAGPALRRRPRHEHAGADGTPSAPATRRVLSVS